MTQIAGRLILALLISVFMSGLVTAQSTGVSNTVRIHVGAGWHQLFSPNTNAGGSISEPRTWSAKSTSNGIGAELSIPIVHGLFLGVNGYLVHGNSDFRNPRSLHRAQLTVGYLASILPISDKRHLQLGGQLEVGRIRGASSDIAGDTWHKGTTLTIHAPITANLGIIAHTSWYWHREDLVIGSTTVPQRYWLMGTTVGLT